MTKRSGWEKLSAVKSNRICRDLDRNLLEIPGPRVLGAVPALQRCISAMSFTGAGQSGRCCWPPRSCWPARCWWASPGCPAWGSPIVELRLHRVLTGFIVGAELAGAGVVMQALFRNPLAEPYVLGVSSGAGLGAALAVYLGWSVSSLWSVPAAAFVTGVATLALVYLLAARGGGASIYGLLLSGIIVSAVLSNLLMLIVSLAPVEGMHSILWWILGNLPIEVRRCCS